MKTALRWAFGLVIAAEPYGLIFKPHIDAMSDFTWLGLLGTAAFAWGMAELLDLSGPTRLLALVAVLLDAGSALFLWYSRIEPWDLVMHFLGGATVAAASFEVAWRLLAGGHVSVRRKRLFLGAAVLLAVLLVGFLYELLEYFVDRFQYGYPKTLVNAYDSVEDQAFNLIGGSLILATALFIKRGVVWLRHDRG